MSNYDYTADVESALKGTSKETRHTFDTNLSSPHKAFRAQATAVIIHLAFLNVGDIQGMSRAIRVGQGITVDHDVRDAAAVEGLECASSVVYIDIGIRDRRAEGRNVSASATLEQKLSDILVGKDSISWRGGLHGGREDFAGLEILDCDFT